MDIFLKEIQLTKLNQTHDHGLQIHREQYGMHGTDNTYDRGLTKTRTSPFQTKHMIYEANRLVHLKYFLIPSKFNHY